MTKRYKIIEPAEYRLGTCSKCEKIKPVVKVMDIKTGEIEWRCRGHVRYLQNGEEVSYKLADINIERMKREAKKQ